MKHVYVAGPIGAEEGRAQRVLDAIHVGEKIRRAGLFPFVPHLYVQWGAVYQHHYECWMRLDFAWLHRCDALFRMDGHSPGADREVIFAQDHNIPVFLTVPALVEWARSDG